MPTDHTPGRLFSAISRFDNMAWYADYVGVRFAIYWGKFANASRRALLSLPKRKCPFLSSTVSVPPEPDDPTRLPVALKNMEEVISSVTSSGTDSYSSKDYRADVTVGGVSRQAPH